MTTIVNDDVRQLAALSAIDLSDDEISALQHDIDNILGYVKKLDELDTDGVEPTYQVTDLENVWREDEVEKSPVLDKLLELAPEHAKQQIKVPKVL